MFASSFGSKQGEGAIRVVPERDGIIAMCLEGEFDMANASVVREQIDEALATGDDLILDLDQATFVDSSIISVLFESVRAAGARDQRVVLQLGSTPIVEQALEIVDSERIVARGHDRDEAVGLIRRQRAA